MPPPPAAPPAGPQLDSGTLDGILGYSERASGSVVQYSIDRRETIVAQTLRANGIEVTAMHQLHIGEQPKIYYND